MRLFMQDKLTLDLVLPIDRVGISHALAIVCFAAVRIYSSSLKAFLLIPGQQRAQDIKEFRTHLIYVNPEFAGHRTCLPHMEVSACLLTVTEAGMQA